MTKLKTKVGRIYKKWNLRGGVRVEHDKWTVRYKGHDYATGESDERKARQFLTRLISGAIPAAKSDTPEPVKDPVVFINEILDNLEGRSKRRGNATTFENAGRVDLHLRPFFGSVPAGELTSRHVDRYCDHRITEGAKPGTINKELAMLKRALNLAVRHEPPIITRFPKIEMLKVSNVRKGFLAHRDYLRLKQHLPAYLVPVLVAAYHVGNRRGELLQVEIDDVELDAQPQPQFRLYGDATKTGEGRVIPLIGEMASVFQEQIARTKAEYPRCRWLFHVKGEPILTFYKAWDTATTAAGLPGLLFHDLRRTAVRNLIRALVPRSIAMQITGHKTEAVFERYNITDEADLQSAASKVASYISQLGPQ